MRGASHAAMVKQILRVGAGAPHGTRQAAMVNHFLRAQAGRSPAGRSRARTTRARAPTGPPVWCMLSLYHALARRTPLPAELGPRLEQSCREADVGIMSSRACCAPRSAAISFHPRRAYDIMTS